MSDTELDFPSLLSRVKDHDEAASRALVERLYPLVARVVRSHLPRRDEVEDLMQEVFLKVFSRLGQYRASAPFEHWVARVAARACLDELRYRRRRPVWRWSDLSEEEQAGLEALLVESEPSRTTADWGVVEQLLGALSPEDRLIIHLMELEEKSVSEVRELTGWSAGVVRIRAFRARARLKKLWEQRKETT